MSWDKRKSKLPNQAHSLCAGQQRLAGYGWRVPNSVSTFAQNCCRTGLRTFVPAWNADTIPRKGIPDVLFANNLRTSTVPLELLPPAQVLSADYIANGEHLTHPTDIGCDPLVGHADLLQQRDSLFSTAYPSFEDIFYSTVTGQHAVFTEALLSYIDITQRLRRNQP